MAGPIPTDVIIDQSRDWYLTVTYVDPLGAPVDLTGYTALFALAQGSTREVKLSLSTDAGITLGGVAGTVSLHATHEQTSIDAGPYMAELYVTSPGGIETPLLKGNIPVIAKVA